MARTDVAITLPKLDLQLMEVTIIGDSPLIVHNWSQKSKLEMLAKQTKKATAKKAAKDPHQDFEDSMYPLPDGGYGFPSVGFKKAAVTACTSVGGVTKVAARQAFSILGETAEVEGAFDGAKARVDLVRIEGGKPGMREDMVRVGMDTADLRYRAEFWPWWAKVLVKFNANVLSTEQIMNLLNTAGFAVGIGEWRMEKAGDYGSFHVASEKELAALLKEAA